MIKIDLITGFLGAGKTTFLLGYAKYFIKQGKKTGILLYDYGAVNVDMMLLGELRSQYCELEMVAAGCDSDCLKRRFKTKLIAMAMSGYDRVLVEPSGVFDMDEFFDALRDEPLERFYEAGSVLTVVDGSLEEEFSQKADFLLASQVAYAGKILLSKTQDITCEQADKTKAHVLRALKNIGCGERHADFCDKPWNEFNDDDYREFSECGYRISDYVKAFSSDECGFGSVCVLKSLLTLSQLKAKTEYMFNSSQFGEVLRVKGFVFDGGVCYQFNATKNKLTFEPIRNGQAVVMVVGAGLDREKIVEYLSRN